MKINENKIYNLIYNISRKTKKENKIYEERIIEASKNLSKKTKENINNQLEFKKTDYNKNTDKKLESYYNNIDYLIKKKILLKEMLNNNFIYKNKKHKHINLLRLNSLFALILSVIIICISLSNGFILTNFLCMILPLLIIPSYIVFDLHDNKKIINTLKKNIKSLNDENITNETLSNENKLKFQIGITNNGLRNTIDIINNLKNNLTFKSDTNDNKTCDKKNNLNTTIFYKDDLLDNELNKCNDSKLTLIKKK